jgi:hypothetical protein
MASLNRTSKVLESRTVTIFSVGAMLSVFSVPILKSSKNVSEKMRQLIAV